MLYVQLDANWPDHPAVMVAGLEAAGLHAIAMCLAKRLNMDGWVTRPHLHRHKASDELIDQLVGLGLLDAAGDRVRPAGWHERNPTKAAIAAKAAAKKRSAKEGNHKRWEHAGPVDDCAICYPEAQVIAGSDTGAMAPTDTGAIPIDIDRVIDKGRAKDDATPALPALTADDRQQRIMKAARQLAEERAVGRDVGEGWIVAATKGIAGDNHQALHLHLTQHPEATVMDLLELMDATRNRPALKTGGVISREDAVFLPGSGWCART